MIAEKRGSWYLLTGLIIGLAFGLVYSWVIAPVKYVDAAPNALREDFKNQYRALIAAAYMVDGDLGRAKARLVTLKDANMAQAVAMQAQQALAEGRPEEETRALGLLAVALGQGPTPVVTGQIPITTPTSQASPTVSPTPLLSQPTDTPSTPGAAGSTPSPTVHSSRPTNTPLPSRTPTVTPGAPFILLDQAQVCSPSFKQPLIQVEALDAASQPVPGVEVIVSWEGNEEHFFTGLKPELGSGYADFTMTPGVTYALRLADGGEPISNLTPVECAGVHGNRYWGSWLLTFAQP